MKIRGGGGVTSAINSCHVSHHYYPMAAIPMSTQSQRSKLRVNCFGVSLDGSGAGPRQDLSNPLGVGGMRLHEWVLTLASWRAQHGQPGGEVNDSSVLIDETTARMGATSGFP